MIEQMLIALCARGHCLTIGVPGLAKTLTVSTLAQALHLKFSRVQFTPDLMPSDITGTEIIEDVGTTGRREFRFVRGPIFANIVLADEINRTPPKTQAALLQSMQEYQVTAGGKTLELDLPFFVMATQNPIEQEGTYPLPQAQLDRFLIKAFIDYPKADDEVALVRQITDGAIGDGLDLSRVACVLEPADVLDIQSVAAGLTIDDSILDYAVRMVRATREWQGIDNGAGPRASIALVRAARAQALLSGNDFVTPSDVKAVAHAVLRHRIKLGADLEIEGYRSDDVLAELLASVAAPRS